jgi:Ca2+-binding EF-hand superfamily protein
MNKFALAAAAALTVGTFGIAAIAQDATDDFKAVDANKDGVVSYEEALGLSATLTQVIFDQADENDDGTLDEAEFTSLKTLVTPENDSSSSSSSVSVDPSSSSSSSTDATSSTSAP